MGRASGEPPSPGGGGPPPNPDVARIRQRLARMAPQTKALQLALARYHDDAGSFDLGLWEEAFTSDDPQTINHVVEVTGGYEGPAACNASDAGHPTRADGWAAPRG